MNFNFSKISEEPDMLILEKQIKHKIKKLESEIVSTHCAAIALEKYEQNKARIAEFEEEVKTIRNLPLITCADKNKFTNGEHYLYIDPAITEIEVRRTEKSDDYNPSKLFERISIIPKEAESIDYCDEVAKFAVSVRGKIIERLRKENEKLLAEIEAAAN